MKIATFIFAISVFHLLGNIQVNANTALKSTVWKSYSSANFEIYYQEENIAPSIITRVLEQKFKNLDYSIYSKIKTGPSGNTVELDLLDKSQKIKVYIYETDFPTPPITYQSWDIGYYDYAKQELHVKRPILAQEKYYPNINNACIALLSRYVLDKKLNLFHANETHPQPWASLGFGLFESGYQADSTLLSNYFLVNNQKFPPVESFNQWANLSNKTNVELACALIKANILRWGYNSLVWATIFPNGFGNFGDGNTVYQLTYYYSLAGNDSGRLREYYRDTSKVIYSFDKPSAISTSEHINEIASEIEKDYQARINHPVLISIFRNGTDYALTRDGTLNGLLSGGEALSHSVLRVCNDPDLRGLLRHEYTHNVVAYITKNRISPWLNEGIASHYGNRQSFFKEQFPSFHKNFWTDKHQYFPRLDSIFQVNDGNFGYTWAHYSYEFLLSRFPKERIRSFIENSDNFSLIGYTNVDELSRHVYETAYYDYMPQFLFSPKWDASAVYAYGNTYSFTWDRQYIKTLKADYSIDGGKSWILVKELDLSTNTLNWTIPEAKACLLRFSDSRFPEISFTHQLKTADKQNLLLSSPNGGEYFIAGDTVRISWAQTIIPAIKLEFSDNNGTRWNAIQTNIATSSGFCKWVVPAIASTQCRVRISDVSDASKTYTSEKIFTILKSNLVGGPYLYDKNTVLLLHFDNDLKNRSNQSGDGNGLIENITSDPAVSSALGNCFNPVFPVTVSHTANLNLTGDWTIEAWVKAKAFNNIWMYIVSKPGDLDATQANYALYINPYQKNSFFALTYLDASNRLGFSTMTPALNEWYHVAYIRDTQKSELRILVHDKNRTLIANQPVKYTGSGALLNSKDLLLGSGFSGYIDEVRISNVVRNFDVPSVPSSPTPKDLTTGLKLNTDLSWTNGSNSPTIDLYLGTNNPPTTKVLDNVAVVYSFDPGVLLYDKTYYWQVVARNSDLTTKGPIWSFSTEKDPSTIVPTAPSKPNPLSYAFVLANDVSLSWVNGSNSPTIDLYFGTENPPATKVLDNVTAVNSYDPGILLFDKTYYWQVVARNSALSTKSPVWSFSTKKDPNVIVPTAPSLPNPQHLAKEVKSDESLSWVNGSNTQIIDLYFGTDNPPVNKVLDNVTAISSFNPGVLLSNVTYYWQVVARNTSITTNSPVWSFTTRNRTATEMVLHDDLPAFFPNPSTGIIHLHWDNTQSQKFCIRIFDTNNKTVYNKWVTSSENEVIDLSNSPKGIYFVQLKDEKQVKIKKIILQ